MQNLDKADTAYYAGVLVTSLLCSTEVRYMGELCDVGYNIHSWDLLFK